MPPLAGNLIVDVFNVSEANPIEDVLVRIYPQNSEEVLFELSTNSSGQTTSVSLPAPPKEYSLDPDDTEKPYSEYRVTAEKEGFIFNEINGVQIFADTTAIQRINLLPLNESNQEETIDTPPPVLWGDYPSKIPEEEIKPLPEETGFVVLDEVVIPEFIVVHDGPPDSEAENYYVPFKDYIKNVASSEIYSTWNEEAIKANILAIISFTLNRVYTEWYRSRGKNFTITNSTAYDQSFSYGRNIYEEISTLVDELFTTYIKREGQRQPLFAQYCDGRRVSCPEWLSQWGSEALASQGYSAIEILRNYYGNDIYLANAESVSGVPYSYPGYNLTIGSSGEAVITIQQQLNSIANTYSAIPTLRVDGVFGENTAEAVRVFQDIFNLPQTGVVDLATWYQIS